MEETGFRKNYAQTLARRIFLSVPVPDNICGAVLVAHRRDRHLDFDSMRLNRIKV
jgi:hypothetical protein